MSRRRFNRKASIARKVREVILGTGLSIALLLIVIVFFQKLWIWIDFNQTIEKRSEQSKENNQKVFRDMEEAAMSSYANASIRYFDEYFENIRKQTEAFAEQMSSSPSEEELQVIMTQMELYDDQQPNWLILYIVMDSGEIMGSREEIGEADFPDLRKEKWYRKAKKRFEQDKKTKYYWSDVVKGKLSDDHKVICAQAYRGSDGEFAGVVAASVDVSSFGRLLNDFGGDKRIGIAIYDRSGKTVGKSDSFREIENAADDVKLGKYYTQGDIGYVFYNMQETDWQICLQQSRRERLLREERIQEDFKQFAGDINKTMFYSNIWGFVVLSALVIVAVFVMRYLSKSLSQSLVSPLMKMVGQVEEFGEDNGFAYVDVTTDDEIGQLARAFNRMAAKLREDLEHIDKISRENERMESERGMVHRIQQNNLPQVFPAFPNRRELDIYASLLPAAQGGGTFYDFFFIDAGTFCFVIGEASGNGFLATIFALLAKTVIKSHAMQGHGADRILAETNNQMAYGNDEGTVANVFVGIVHLSSGKLEYATAGELPVLWKHSGEELAPLPETNGVTLGNMENVPYRKRTVLLSQGDLIFAHTKDTPECVDGSGNIYTAEYLYDKLTDLVSGEYRIIPIIDGLTEDIKAYTAGADQEEDVTLLMFRYWG